MTLALILLLLGAAFSAFFSGSETGLYRVNRARLVLDGLGGDLPSRWLLTFTNHPTLFVATVLVGNNLANYVTSLGIVMGTQYVFGAGGWSELVTPIALSPLLFVYCELLPKRVFYQAPNRLLRRASIPLLACTVIFLPVTGLLWGMSKVLEYLSGESPEQVQLGLARKELQGIFEEGHEAGILRPAQRALAQQLFTVASNPVSGVAIPPWRLTRARQDMKAEEILRLARRHRLAEIPVEEPGGTRRLVGYLRVVDLYLNQQADRLPIRPLVEIADTQTQIAALMQLEASGETLAHVVNGQGQTVGFLTSRQMSEPLFRDVL